MDFKKMLRAAADLLEEGDVRRPKGVKVRLSDKEISDFMDDAEGREYNDLWQQVDECLKALAIQYPLRSARLRRDIKWLRKQGRKRGFAWGRK